MDYKKRELSKLAKAYDLIHEVEGGYYENQIYTPDDMDLNDLKNTLESIFDLNGYRVKVNSYDKFVLVKQ